MFKSISFSKRICLVAAPFLLCTVIAWTGIGHSTVAPKEQPVDGLQRFHNRIRDGLGREVQFASTNESTENIRASVNSVAQFIFKRSGVKINGKTRSALADLEEQTLNGTRRRITLGE